MRWNFSKAAMFDVVGIGRNSWDRIGLVAAYPPSNTKTEIEVLENQPGGQVATTVVTTARLGLRSRYLGKFGDDAAGRAVRGALVHEGIDLSEAKVVPEVSNQTAFIVVDRTNKTRNVFVYSDPRLKLSPEDFSHESITSGKILYLGGREPAAALAFARIGKDGGSKILLDADAVGDGILDLLPLADVVICPEAFPTRLMGERSLERATEWISRMGPAVVCCTRGADGVIVFCDGALTEMKSIDVDIVDTTGAGDVFQGGFIYGMIEQWPLERTLRFASACAALKCRTLGGQKGIPKLAQVETFLAAHA